MRPLLALLPLCLLVAAEEKKKEVEIHPSAPTVFRTPDIHTKREIDDLMSHKGLGSGTRDVRTASRAKLLEIGTWTVPYLCESIAGRKRRKGIRIPMNAVMTLGRILDPNCLEAVRDVAQNDDHSVDVRKTACLVLGMFPQGVDENVAALTRMLTQRKQNDTNASQLRRSCALALGKIDTREATATLLAHVKPQLPKDTLVAGAALLGATIRARDAEPERFLEHKEGIVRLVAATGLLIRPLGPKDKTVVLGALKRQKAGRVRARLYTALAAIQPRTDEIRNELLECAKRSREDKEARIAALIGLASEYNVRDNFKPLKSAYNREFRGRNDPVGAAMLFAMAMSGAPEAIDELRGVVKGGSGRARFYAAGSLLYLASLADPGKRPDMMVEDRIGKSIAVLRTESDPQLRELERVKGSLVFESDLAKRVETARAAFASPELRDPFRLHLWDWSQEDRAWAYVNRLIPAFFKLDDIADKSDYYDPNKAGNQPLLPPPTAPKGERKAPSATPEEQDLLDFLFEQPYYEPGDLGER